MAKKKVAKKEPEKATPEDILSDVASISQDLQAVLADFQEKFGGDLPFLKKWARRYDTYIAQVLDELRQTNPDLFEAKE